MSAFLSILYLAKKDDENVKNPEEWFHENNKKNDEEEIIEKEVKIFYPTKKIERKFKNTKIEDDETDSE